MLGRNSMQFDAEFNRAGGRIKQCKYAVAAHLNDFALILRASLFELEQKRFQRVIRIHLVLTHQAGIANNIGKQHRPELLSD